MLKISNANTKIKELTKVKALQPYLAKRKVYSLDLISGWSCPLAKDCLSKVHEIDGKRKLKDGPHTQFRCFSASQEALFTNVFKKRKANFEALKSAGSSDDMAMLIENMLPKNLGVFRYHVGGDFFNQDYFDAAITVAKNNPDILFYAYTKSLNFWVKRLNSIPNNLVLTASRGGRLDNLIDKHSLREAVVVFNEQQAKEKGLEIDHDDSHAADPSKANQSFALLIHGVQPKDSEASKAVRQLKGKGSYGKGLK